MQTAQARIGMLQTLKNVFHNEGTTYNVFINIRLFGAVQWTFRIASTASDIFDGPLRRLRETQRSLFPTRRISLPRQIDSNGFRLRMVRPLLVELLMSRIGGVVGNPADVLNVRMQNDLSLPPEQRRNYKHALDGLIRVIREEGPASLLRGLMANTSRGVLMTAGQLASYDEFKKLLLKTGLMGDNLATHFTASFMAGFVATTMFVLSDLD